MAKRIYSESVKKWLINSGVAAGSIIGGIFLYLAFMGAITITGNSGDLICEGSFEKPCYAYINFTANEDIFIYPMDYDPWGRETPLVFEPGVKDWKLQRSWGSGWRNIPLDKSCTGTWCGLSNKADERKFSVAFREGRNYEIRIVVYKNDPHDKIKWSFGPLDPTFFGIDMFKSYDSELKEMTFRDENLKDIAKAKLNTPLKNYVPHGKDRKVAEIKVTTFQNYSNALEKIDLYDKNKGMNKFTRSFDYKVINYQEIIRDYENGTIETEIKEVYAPLEKSDFIEGEVLTIGIFTDVYIGDNVEWVPTFFGSRINEWATWESDNIIVDGLPDVGALASASVLYKDESWFLISGNSSGLWNGFVLASNGTTWIFNSTIIDGLPKLDGQASVTTFTMGTDSYLITGGEWENYRGFVLASNGTTWISNTTINSGLIDEGGSQVPNVFQIGDDWYFLGGQQLGSWAGYAWDGTNWIVNTTINASVASHSYGASSGFYKDESYYLITSNSTGLWKGYVWDNGDWATNSTITDGLTTIVAGYQRFSVFYKDVSWFLVSGANDGNFYGFNITGVSADSCTPPGSGVWNIDCSDNCTWATNQIVPGNISISGAGMLNLNANFTYTGSDQYIFIIDNACELVMKL